MMIDIVDIEAVLSTTKHYLAERKRYAKICEHSNQDYTQISPKQVQKINADLGWAAMELVKIEAQLHADCVNAGVADLRGLDHYEDGELRPSAWHRYKFVKPIPRILGGRSQ